MSQRTNNAAKGVALLLVFVVLQVYVHAELLGATHTAAATAAVQSPSGRLSTRGNAPVMVNGTSARTGQTIFSGQQIQTPEGTGATVQLGRLGRVDVAPGTILTLTFDAGTVTVNLVSGCVIVTANKGITGTIQMPGGEAQHTDSDKGSSIDVCVGRTPGAAPIVGQGAAAAAGAGAGTSGAAGAGGAAAGGLFGLGMPATIALFAIAGGTTAGIIAANRPDCVPRGANPSPGTPRGPCQ
jgi:hypothetical protein